MTHLANAIRRLMLTRPKLTDAEVARRAGFDRSYLSRLKNGQVGISVDALANLALALGRNNKERAALIAAHMKDESCGYYPDFIQVTFNGKLSATELHPDIEYLQEHLSDSRLRTAVKSLVELHRGNGTRVVRNKMR